MGMLLVFFIINVFVIISMANLKKGSLTDIVWLAPDQFAIGVKMFQPVEGRGVAFSSDSSASVRLQTQMSLQMINGQER